MTAKVRRSAFRPSSKGGGGGSALPDPVTAAHGGTGLTTLTSGSLLTGAGTGNVTFTALPLTVTNGGTGAATLTSGALLKGAGTSAIAAADLTGDVTTSGALATTIAAAAVTLAKMANLAANTLIGNNTGSSATPLALTKTQVQTWLTGWREVALTPSANTYTIPDITICDLGTLTLAATNTIANPTGTPVTGQFLGYRIAQDGTGSRTTAWGNVYKFTTTFPQPTLSTGINVVDEVFFHYDGTSSKFICDGYNLGIA